MDPSALSSKTDSPPTLQQTIGGWQVMFYGLGSMLGAGIYALIGRAADSLGNAVWLAFLVAMIAAMLTGLSYACVGSRYPKAGGAAYVTQHGLHKPLLSYVVGIAVMMSGLTSMATGSQAIAEQLEKALGLAQKECDRKNMAEHVANERVKLLAINEQNWVEAPSRLDVPVRDGGKSI